MRFLISGGGTGGHVYPALTVVAELKNAARAPEFLFVGRADGIEARLTTAMQIPFQSISVGGVRGMGVITAARNSARLLFSAFRARAILRDFQPHAIFATGGYVSAPVIWAGALEKIPSVIYLPDLEPGWAIRFSARVATRIAVSFEQVAKFFAREKTMVTGYPVRAEFFKTDSARARQRFGFDANARVVTILGGSRGAHAINAAAAQQLPTLAKLAHIVCITGVDDEEWMRAQVDELKIGDRVRVFGYVGEELPDALAAADIVVARAGASALGELPALGLPAILVPYPHAGQHQELNAQFLVERGAAIRISNADLERALLPTITRVLNAPEELQKMRAAMRALAAPDAAKKIARLIQSVAAC